jgi:nonribosomal peptide synthetase DhbF
MVPAAVVHLAELPLTAAGMVDHRRLPAVAAEPVRPGRPGEGPATRTEELVCRVWAEAMGVPAVPPTADFFDSGGHSLQAMRIVGRIEQELDVAVPLGLLFEAGTPRELALRLDAQLE